MAVAESPPAATETDRRLTFYSQAADPCGGKLSERGHGDLPLAYRTLARTLVAVGYLPLTTTTVIKETAAAAACRHRKTSLYLGWTAVHH